MGDERIKDEPLTGVWAEGVVVEDYRYIAPFAWDDPDALPPEPGYIWLLVEDV